MKILNNLTKENILATFQLLKIHILILKLFIFHLLSSWMMKIFH